MSRHPYPKISEVYFAPRLLTSPFEDHDIRRDAALAGKKFYTLSHFPHIGAAVWWTVSDKRRCTLGDLLPDMEGPTGL